MKHQAKVGMSGYSMFVNVNISSDSLEGCSSCLKAVTGKIDSGITNKEPEDLIGLVSSWIKRRTAGD